MGRPLGNAEEVLNSMRGSLERVGYVGRLNWGGRDVMGFAAGRTMGGHGVAGGQAWLAERDDWSTRNLSTVG